MATLNRVLLIGIVGEGRRTSARDRELVIAVPEEREGGTWLERIVVVVGGHGVDKAMDLRPAQPVHVEGYVASAGGRVVVVATRLFPLGEAPPLSTRGRPRGDHASPRPHQRSGHPRRIHPGRPDERVIWVRPTMVRASRLDHG